MRRHKTRWILSLASTLPFAAASAGCVDEHSPDSEEEADAAVPRSDAGAPGPLNADAATPHPPGVMVRPDAGGTTLPGILVNADAGGTTLPGIVVNADAGGTPFPGIVVNLDAGGHLPGLVLVPDASLYPINGIVVRPPDAGSECEPFLLGIIVTPPDAACPRLVFPGVIARDVDPTTGMEQPVGVVVRPASDL